MNENLGWIKLHRSILKWEWWDDHNTSRLWIYLLHAVNYEDKKWHGRVIKRGQIITSYAQLAKACGLSVKKIRVSLNKLKTTHEVAHQTTSQYSIITVCKYDSYQAMEIPKGKPKGKQVGKQRASEGQLLKNVKKERTNKIEGKTTPKSSLEWLRSDEYISMMQERYPELDVIPIINKSYYYYQDSGGKTAKGQPIKDFHRAGARWLSGAEDERLKEVAEWKEARRPKFQS